MSGEVEAVFGPCWAILDGGGQVGATHYALLSLAETEASFMDCPGTVIQLDVTCVQLRPVCGSRYDEDGEPVGHAHDIQAAKQLAEQAGWVYCGDGLWRCNTQCDCSRWAGA